jgi:hypothetical protein
MTNNPNIPSAAYVKLLHLSDVAEHLSDKITETEKAIATARTRLSGGLPKQQEYEDLSASLKQLVADKPALERKLHAAKLVHFNCKTFLNSLPTGVVLEPVEVKTDGQSLEDVRAKREVAENELKVLHSIPTASADIEAKIRSYVESLGRPTITGIGSREKLKVVWPGAGFDNRGPREDRADVLPLMAILHGEAMVAALMQEVERMTSGVLPIKDRGARIAALSNEIEQLAYVEEALVSAAIAEGMDIERSPSALPQAVLQVRIAEAKRSRAA